MSQLVQGVRGSNSHSPRTENTMLRCTSVFIFQAFWKMKGAFENALDQINAHSITLEEFF